MRASRRGRPIGLMDPRLLALVAFGSASQIVFGKWIGGHYYVMPLALVFLWDVVRTAPVEAGGASAGIWARKAWAGVPAIGLGSAMIFRSVTQWDPWWFKLSLMGLLFLSLVLITLRAALSDTPPNPDSYKRAVT
jgi:hypothetical protein